MKDIARPPLPILTSLRFFAAVEVVAFHVLMIRNPSNFIDGLFSAGYQAVTFFFVLSGFILTYAYSVSSTSGALDVGAVAFWKARFARIYPGYIAGLAIGLPLLAYGAFISHITPPEIYWPTFTLFPLLLQSWWPPVVMGWNPPAWSLSVEMLFYALFPFLARLFHRSPPARLLFICLVLVMLVAGLRHVIEPFADSSRNASNFLSFFPPFHLPAFLFGMALGRLFLFGQSRTDTVHLVLFVVGAVALMAILGFRYRLPWWVTSDAVLTPLYGAVIFGGARGHRMLKPLTSKVMVLLGEASYAMYIIHMPVLWWWTWVLEDKLNHTLPKGLNALLFVLLIIVLSVLLFKLWESPLRRRILDHKAQKAD